MLQVADSQPVCRVTLCSFIKMLHSISKRRIKWPFEVSHETLLPVNTGLESLHQVEEGNI